MRTFIHACIHACIHMCIHLTHGHTDALAYILPTCLHADLQTFLLYVLETFMQACIHTWRHRCIQVYILWNRHFYVPHAVIPSLFSLDTHTWTSLQAYIPPQLHPYMHAHCIATKLHLPTCRLQAYAPRHVHTCRHKYMHACIHACIAAHVHARIHRCACIRTGIHILHMPATCWHRYIHMWLYTSCSCSHGPSSDSRVHAWS